MKLRAVRLWGFRVFEDFHFPFPASPGLYLVAGENRDRPELGSNGVGKSSLFDGIHFALYGQSLRGLKGKELLRDGASHCAVELETSQALLLRTWAVGKKMGLAKDNLEVGQAEVDKTFVLDKEVFATTTLVGQGVPLFVDLPPSAQVHTLQKLLSMERWLGYAEMAGRRGEGLEKTYAAAATRLARLQGERDAIDVPALKRSGADWEDQRRARLLVIEHNIASLGPIPIDPAGTAAQAKINERRANSSVDAAASVVNDLNAELRGLQSECKGLAGQSAALKEEVEFFMSTPTCPTCKQVIGADHTTLCLSVLQDKSKAKAAEYQSAQRRAEALFKQKETALETLSRAQDKASRAREARRAAEEAAVMAESQRQQRERLVGLRDAVSLEANPVAELIEQAESKLTRLGEEVQALTGECAALQRQSQAYSLWKRGFKAIRSQLISEALVQFETDIAAVLEDLGLFGWQVIPYVDPSVFDSARSATGFKFAVVDPDRIERPLEAYSGGEFQRIRLAVQLGLSSLVGAVAGPGWDFEVFDEPSSYLSEEGVVGLFASLKARAQRLQKTIFIIDHHQVHYADLDGIFTLIREGGTTVLQ